MNKLLKYQRKLYRNPKNNKKHPLNNWNFRIKNLNQQKKLRIPVNNT